MSFCPICESSHRHQIETALLNGDSLDSVMNSFANSCKFSMDQLKVHAVSHLRVPESSSNESIASRLALKEADTLAATCAEYMATLKRVGETIDSQISSVESGDLAIGQALTKSVVDLYLGTGNQIRETVKLLIEAERDLNDSEESSGNVSSIRRLTEAIDRSRRAG